MNTMGRNKTIMKYLLVIFLLLTSVSAAGKTLLGERDIKGLLESDWIAIQAQHKFDPANPQSIDWGYRLTPGFPVVWPPQGSVTLVYYGYPYGFSENLRDGEYIGKLWARVEVASAKEPVKTVLLQNILKIGIQRVRPLGSREIQVAENGLIVQDYLGKLTTLPAEQSRKSKMMRDYYCFWLRTNSVIGDSMRKQHPDFISWLQCKNE
jgi:hypothetical protein